MSHGNYNTTKCISVIIPTCNRDEYLLEAINSVKSQESSPLEILVVNNGHSPINPAHIPDGVHIMEIPPLSGPSSARNAGALAAKGQFLAFLDDDDKWDSAYLGLLLASLRTNEADCAFATRIKFYANGRVKAYKNALPERIPTSDDWNFYKAPGFGGTNFLIKRDIFLKAQGFDTALYISEDQDLFVRLSLTGAKFATCPEAVCLVRQHSRPRLRDDVLKGTWLYYRKYREQLHPKHHLHFLFRLVNSAKKMLIHKARRLAT